MAVTAVEKPRRPRPRDPIFDAVVGVCRIDPKDLTTSARGSINTAVRQLRDVGATPGDIVRRARRYRDRYPHTSLTPTALAKHWPALTAAPPTTADSYDPLASARRH